MSIRDKIATAAGTEKLNVLADAIDEVSRKMEAKSASPATPMDPAELLAIEALSQQLGCNSATLVRNLKKTLGDAKVIRIGNQYFIRKANWLVYLLALEGEA